MASIHKTSSPYRGTDITDFYLDFWHGITIEEDLDDELITVGTKYEGRPDLLSYDRYGTPRLWWVFVLRNMNKIKDPLEDFTADLQIYVPSRERIEDFL